jgi:hypothetical protein
MPLAGTNLAPPLQIATAAFVFSYPLLFYRHLNTVEPHFTYLISSQAQQGSSDLHTHERASPEGNLWRQTFSPAPAFGVAAAADFFGAGAV